MRSRFEWGLIADIQPPDLETKIAILQKKAENERFSLPDDVAEYIARAIKSNVRELEGALTRLMAYGSLTGAAITLSTAQQVLRNIIASQEKRVTIDLIQKRVSEHFDLREQDLKIRSNTRAIAFPRQVAMYIVKQLTTASLPEIGRQFGGKHHTTVLHSINKIEELRRSDKDLNRTITTFYGSERAKEIRSSLDPQCLSGFRKNEKFEIEHSDVILTVDNGDFVFFDCAYEELLQSLGPINDTSSVPWTMFNDNVSMGYFDVYDQYLLNLLYDPRIKAGMTVQEVKAVLPDVLADVRAWVRKVNNLP